jgi:hypothetical protein
VRHCPNAGCAYLARTGFVAEFLDTIEVCPHCGNRLRHGEAPPMPRPTYRGLETVYETSDRIQAHLIRSLLEQDDIAAHIAGEPLQGALGELPPTMPSIRVQVAPEHVERARGLISSEDTARRVAHDEDEAKSASRGASRTPAFLLGVILGGLAATVYWQEPTPQTEAPTPQASRPASWDRNRDGRPDAWARYGADGVMVESSYDENLDGSPDLWNELDKAEEIATARYDSDFDGRADYWEDYEQGRARSYSSDNDGDGTRDEWGEFAGFNVKERTWSFGNDAIIDKRAVYENGRRVQEQYDRDRDGRFDETLFLDEFERVIRRDAAR